MAVLALFNWRVGYPKFDFGGGTGFEEEFLPEVARVGDDVAEIFGVVAEVHEGSGCGFQEDGFEDFVDVQGAVAGGYGGGRVSRLWWGGYVCGEVDAFESRDHVG